jgi:peptidoglycan/LPS O-acetylase OafA/YrhL
MSDKRDYIPELTGLRGLAAVAVMLEHTICTSGPIWDWQNTFAGGWPALGFDWNSVMWLFWETPLHLPFAGDEAVALFFVLSGYALALPFLRGTVAPPAIFALQRVIRLYVPFVVALVLALALRATVATVPDLAGASGQFLGFWPSPVTARTLVDHLLMLGDRRLNLVDPPIWSLVPELRLSLIFPLLVLLVLRMRAWLLLPLWFALSVGGFALYFQWRTSLPLLGSLSATIGYSIMFAFGIELAAHRETMTRLLARAGRAGRGLLWLAAILLFSASHDFGWQPPVPPEFGIMIGAALIVGLATSTPFGLPALAGPRLQGLGRISFSLYLVHMSVNQWLGWEFGRSIGVGAVMLLTVPLALASAAGFYWLVEAPSHRWAQGLGRRHRLIPAPAT